MKQFHRVIYISFLILCVIIKVCPKEVIPVPGWFNNVDRYVIHNPKHRVTESSNLINDDTEDNVLRKKRSRLKQRRFKKIRKSLDGSPNADVFEVQELKTKKGKRNRGRHFVKTPTNNVDSNLSGSHEQSKQRKPVDIIVHIKMND